MILYFLILLVAVESKYSYLTVVDKDELKRLFSSDENVFCTFCNSELVECDELYSYIDRLAKKEKRVTYVGIDVTQYHNIDKMYNINEYPKFIFHRGSLRNRVYKEQELDEIPSFLRDGLEEVVTVLKKDEDVRNLEKQTGITYFILYASKETPSDVIKSFTDMADVYQEYTETGFFIASEE